MMRFICLITLSIACAPSTPKAEAAPPVKSPKATAPSTPKTEAAPPAKSPKATAPSNDDALGTLAGEPLGLSDLKPEQRAILTRHEAKASLERWMVLRNLAKDAALNKALSIGAKQDGLNAQQFLAKMKTEVPANPVTAEIIQAVFMGNQQHFEGQTLDQVKGMIRVQLGKEFASVQEHEIRDRLLKRFPFVATIKTPELPIFNVDDAASPSMGGAKAKVTVVLFSDFECPYCGRQAKLNEGLAKHYADSVRWVYRHYPLDFHKHATKLAVAAICAQEQTKFWAFHDRLFDMRSGFDKAGLRDHAAAVGVADLGRFMKCLGSPAKLARIANDKKVGDAAMIEGTPALFINGKPLYTMIDGDALQALINHELKAAGVKPPPPMAHQH
jgi:protein-disulfide isomerase